MCLDPAAVIVRKEQCIRDPRMGPRDSNRYRCETCNDYCALGHPGYVELPFAIPTRYAYKSITKILHEVCLQCKGVRSDNACEACHAAYSVNFFGKVNDAKAFFRQPPKSAFIVVLTHNGEHTLLSSDELYSFLEAIPPRVLGELGFSSAFLAPGKAAKLMTRYIRVLSLPDQPEIGRRNKRSADAVDNRYESCLKDIMRAVLRSQEVEHDAFVQVEMMQLYEAYCEVMVGKKKETVFRKVPSKCVPCARAIITLDRTLPCDEIGVPMGAAENILVPDIVNGFNIEQLQRGVDAGRVLMHQSAKTGKTTQLRRVIVREGDTVLGNGPPVTVGPHNKEHAQSLLATTESTLVRAVPDACAHTDIKLELGDRVERLLRNGDYVQVTRNPLLVPGCLLTLRVRIVFELDVVYRFPASTCRLINGDFDGDTLVLIPLYGEALYVARIRMDETNRTPSGKPIYSLQQDLLVGIYALSVATGLSRKHVAHLIRDCHVPHGLQERVPDIYAVSTGREVISMVLPSDFTVEHRDIRIHRGCFEEGAFDAPGHKAFFGALWNPAYMPRQSEARRVFDSLNTLAYRYNEVFPGEQTFSDMARIMADPRTALADLTPGQFHQTETGIPRWVSLLNRTASNTVDTAPISDRCYHAMAGKAGAGMSKADLKKIFLFNPLPMDRSLVRHAVSTDQRATSIRLAQSLTASTCLLDTHPGNLVVYLQAFAKEEMKHKDIAGPGYVMRILSNVVPMCINHMGNVCVNRRGAAPLLPRLGSGIDYRMAVMVRVCSAQEAHAACSDFPGAQKAIATHAPWPPTVHAPFSMRAMASVVAETQGCKADTHGWMAMASNWLKQGLAGERVVFSPPLFAYFVDSICQVDHTLRDTLASMWMRCMGMPTPVPDALTDRVSNATFPPGTLITELFVTEVSHRSAQTYLDGQRTDLDARKQISESFIMRIITDNKDLVDICVLVRDSFCVDEAQTMLRVRSAIPAEDITCEALGIRCTETGYIQRDRMMEDMFGEDDDVFDIDVELHAEQSSTWAIRGTHQDTTGEHITPEVIRCMLVECVFASCGKTLPVHTTASEISATLASLEETYGIDVIVDETHFLVALRGTTEMHQRVEAALRLPDTVIRHKSEFKLQRLVSQRAFCVNSVEFPDDTAWVAILRHTPSKGSKKSPLKGVLALSLADTRFVFSSAPQQNIQQFGVEHARMAIRYLCALSDFSDDIAELFAVLVCSDISSSTLKFHGYQKRDNSGTHGHAYPLRNLLFFECSSAILPRLPFNQRPVDKELSSALSAGNGQADQFPFIYDSAIFDTDPVVSEVLPAFTAL